MDPPSHIMGVGQMIRSCMQILVFGIQIIELSVQFVPFQVYWLTSRTIHLPPPELIYHITLIWEDLSSNQPDLLQPSPYSTPLLMREFLIQKSAIDPAAKAYMAHHLGNSVAGPRWMAWGSRLADFPNGVSLLRSSAEDDGESFFFF